MNISFIILFVLFLFYFQSETKTISSETTENIAMIITQCAFIITFLTIIYFTYVMKVEGNIVDQQLENVVSRTNQQLKKVGIQFNYMIPVDEKIKLEDEINHRNNQQLLKQSFILLGLVLLGSLGLNFFLYHRHRFSISKVVGLSLLMTGCVAFTELLFLKVIVVHYISLDPTSVQNTMIRKFLSG